MKSNDKSIPAEYLVSRFLPADHYDIVSYRFTSERKMTPDDLMVAFWADQPRWIASLFKLRNAIVKMFGLKGDNGSIKAIEECIRGGGSYDLVTVSAKSPQETVLCLDDKHLRAYISARIEDEGDMQTASVITLVQFKKRLGRVYFFFIYPFHGLITRSMLKRSVRKLSGC